MIAAAVAAAPALGKFFDPRLVFVLHRRRFRLVSGFSGRRGIFSAGVGVSWSIGSSKMVDDHEIGDWYSVPDLNLRNHRFSVPLDYSSADGFKISVFVREVVMVCSGKRSSGYAIPGLLARGPGFESPRPTEASGWLKKACEEHRVIFLDQRGTGLSTPLTVSSMMQFSSAEKLVEFAKHFRADNIVNDCEFIRQRLVPRAEPWTVLGQSYGGFCAVTYLSFAPQGLKNVLLTGGLPPIGKDCTADEVYKACFDQVIQQNEKYYKRFPQDISVINDLVLHLSEAEGGGVPLPSGGRLTPRGLQSLGLVCLGSSSGFERLHYLFERAWDPILVPGSPRRISYYFLKSFENWVAFDTNPLYALLHESIYCQGAPSRWSAQKIRNSLENVFDPVKSARENRPVYFTGEMVFPWVFEEVGALRHLKEAAHLLSEKQDWPPLYDVATLNKNEVPVAAAVYYEDVYVNFKLSMETAAQISGIRLWITNEFMHSGLRDGGVQVLDHLFGMLKGGKPLY